MLIICFQLKITGMNVHIRHVRMYTVRGHFLEHRLEYGWLETSQFIIEQFDLDVVTETVFCNDAIS